MNYIAAAPTFVGGSLLHPGSKVPDAIVTPAMIAAGVVMMDNVYRATFEGYAFQQQVNKLASSLGGTFADPYTAARMLLRTEWDAKRRVQIEMDRRTAEPGTPPNVEPEVLLQALAADASHGTDFFYRYDHARIALGLYT